MKRALTAASQTALVIFVHLAAYIADLRTNFNFNDGYGALEKESTIVLHLYIVLLLPTQYTILLRLDLYP